MKVIIDIILKSRDFTSSDGQHILLYDQNPSVNVNPPLIDRF